MAPYQDLACTGSLVFGPTTDSYFRNHCSIRKIQLLVPRYRLDRTMICISAPIAPSTSSSSRGSTIDTRACMRICRPVYRPPRRRKEPAGSPIMHRAPPRSEVFPRKARRDLLSIVVYRNTCTIYANCYMKT